MTHIDHRHILYKTAKTVVPDFPDPDPDFPDPDPDFRISADGVAMGGPRTTCSQNFIALATVVPVDHPFPYDNKI